MKVEIHTDGRWKTTEYEYKGFKILIKSKKDKGIKSHCMKDEKVLFTLRYSFCNPKDLLKKTKSKIDELTSSGQIQQAET